MRSLRALWKTRNASSAMVVIGGHAGVTALAAVLRAPTSFDLDLAWPWGRRRPNIVYASDLAEAAAVVSQSRCIGIVTPQELRARAMDLRDAVGRRPPWTDIDWLLEELLGRVPLASATRDEWLAQCGRARSLSRGHEWLKRGLDLCFVTAAAVLLPVSALIVLAAACADLALERRTCVGLGGSRFVARRVGRRAPRSGDSRATASEPRHVRRRLATTCERVLQATRLDQSPLLWNILLGEMTLVGPRLTPCETLAAGAAALPGYAARYAVRPGLIGWAQVRAPLGEIGASPRHELEHDLYYVKHSSIRLDLLILLTALARLTHGAVEATAGSLRSSLQPAIDVVTHVVTRPLDQRGFPGRRRPPIDPALETTLIVGAGEGGKLLARELCRNPNWGYRPVAFIDDDPKKIGTRVQGLPVRGNTQAIPEIVQRDAVDVVIIAIPSGTGVAMARIRERARASSARVLTMPHIGELLRGEASNRKPNDFDLVDVLGRPSVGHDETRCRRFIAGRRVLITGAAGSIGQEVTRQAAQLGAAQVIAVDINETGLFDLQQEVAVASSGTDFRPILASVANPARLAAVFAQHRPEIVFHVAAYKHVPLMEEHPSEAFMANVVGTYETARAAARFGVERFVSVSTDKAVRPSSVMGASKRVAELAIHAVARETGLSACSVRFGNVLGSRGSVMLTFKRQIDAGGPVTVTDSAMKRYFMTIPEAASLIIEAGVLGDRDAIYLLDMGEEVSILDVAMRMIRLRGLRVGKDIQIEFTGLRRGEKLQEELRLGDEMVLSTAHPKITAIVEPTFAAMHALDIDDEIRSIAKGATSGDDEATRRSLFRLVDAAGGGLFAPLDVADVAMTAQ